MRSPWHVSLLQLSCLLVKNIYCQINCILRSIAQKYFVFYFVSLHCAVLHIINIDNIMWAFRLQKDEIFSYEIVNIIMFPLWMKKWIIFVLFLFFFFVIVGNFRVKCGWVESDFEKVLFFLCILILSIIAFQKY